MSIDRDELPPEFALNWMQRLIRWLLWPVLCDVVMRWSIFFWQELPAHVTDEARRQALMSFRNRSGGTRK